MFDGRHKEPGGGSFLEEIPIRSRGLGIVRMETNHGRTLIVGNP